MSEELESVEPEAKGSRRRIRPLFLYPLVALAGAVLLVVTVGAAISRDGAGLMAMAGFSCVLGFLYRNPALARGPLLKSPAVCENVRSVGLAGVGLALVCVSLFLR